MAKRRDNQKPEDKETHLKASITDAGQLDGISKILGMSRVVLRGRHRPGEDFCRSTSTCKWSADVERCLWVYELKIKSWYIQVFDVCHRSFASKCRFSP